MSPTLIVEVIMALLILLSGGKDAKDIGENDIDEVIRRSYARFKLRDPSYLPDV